jgi:hypothetical protein
MPDAGEDLEMHWWWRGLMGPNQCFGPLSNLKGHFSIVCSPQQDDRTMQRGQLILKGLIDHSNQRVSERPLGRPIIRRAMGSAPGLKTRIRNEVQATQELESTKCSRRPGRLPSAKDRCGDEHDAADLLRGQAGQTDRHPTPVRVTDEDHTVAGLFQNGQDGSSKVH